MDQDQLARFEALVLPHLNAASNLARYLLRNASDADDVVQDACFRALRHFDGFRGSDPASGRAWLLTIVRNTAFSWRRSRRGMGPGAETIALEPDDAVSATTADAAVLEDDARSAVARALDALPAEFREVIVLRELEGLSYKEMSDVIGVPVGTVMSRLSRARERLRVELGPPEMEAS